MATYNSCIGLQLCERLMEMNLSKSYKSPKSSEKKKIIEVVLGSYSEIRSLKMTKIIPNRIKKEE